MVLALGRLSKLYMERLTPIKRLAEGVILDEGFKSSEIYERRAVSVIL
jgi:hypothetical protein